jgi:cytochrome P450
MTAPASSSGDASQTPHPLDPDLLAEGVPHERYRQMRETEPVSLQHLPDGQPYWAVTRHEDVLRVSTDTEAFSAASRGMMVENIDSLLPTLLNIDPPEHTEVRRPLTDHFSPRAARALEPWMRGVIGEAFDRAAEMGECDFATDLAAPLPLQVSCRLLGIPEADQARLGAAADKMAAADDPDVAPELQGQERNQAALELGVYGFELGAKLEAAAEGDATDLIALIKRSTIDGATVDTATFSGLFVQVLIGGNETTRSLLCGGMNALLERPESYAALEADPSLIPSAVEEMLRWVAPVHYFRRTPTRDVELGGAQLRAGDSVAMLYAAANRDPDVFAEPDVFDIRRKPNPHVAFGFGEHFCLGARIARMESRVFFEEFFRRFSKIEPTGPVQRVRSNQLNSTKRMPVRLVAR